MESKPYYSSWAAFALFYVVLLVIISILDFANGLFTISYFGVQAGLITLGVAVFAVIGLREPELAASRGVLLAFTVGILTIIPAVLMGLGRIPSLWPQYFYIAFGMAAGSLMTFLFMKFSKRLNKKDGPEGESTHRD